jgi:tRNA uridine 5-carboxymethylaminomethyl modification enzyme
VKYDVIVIGAGHAGCEAALAAAKLGAKVLLTAIDLRSIAYMACNPSIGGTAKGHLVCEIDALGGAMGIVADQTALQIRMLNLSKGAAVYSLRAQSDKVKYHETMCTRIKAEDSITTRECEIKRVLVDDSKTSGVELASGEIIHSDSVIVATGVYLDSKILIGDEVFEKGPSKFERSQHLGKSLLELGVSMRRFKTGTPPRILNSSIDFSKTQEQLGDDDIQSFSFLSAQPVKNLIACHLTYTNKDTHDIIRNNIHRSAMYSGKIEGTGARYCPSIEDKIVRFAHNDRHQVFLEPESLSTNEIYCQGISTSLPRDVQEEFTRTIEGLQNAQFISSAYAIEYSCIDSLQLKPTLEYKGIKNLFFAGQINGTSGYEEAAAQGLIAGINAARAIRGLDEFTLSRTSSYIGVLIDDLTTLGTNEPYRMFTSRAEHRLHLRQDNADVRLTPLGRDIGLVCDARWTIYQQKLKNIQLVQNILQQTVPFERVQQIFEKHNEPSPVGNMTIEAMLRRGNITMRILNNELKLFDSIPASVLDFVSTEIKYSGYLSREASRIRDTKRNENTLLPLNLDYTQIRALRNEAQTKLNKAKPHNISAAGRISGVTPADINVLLVYLKKCNQN